MKSSKAKWAVGASLAAVVATLGVASPAAAASAPYYYGPGVGQYDNNPGDGAQSWAYFANNGGGGVGDSYLNVQFYDGSTAAIWSSPGRANAAEYGKDIFLMQICIGRFDNPNMDCSPWRS